MRRLFPLLLLLAASCAQIVTPDGGAKDVVPPRVVRYNPDSAATNFTGKRIVIRFNEYVQLTDLNNQLVISPPMRKAPDVIIRKRDVVITFRDTLQPNTTYTISFGNAIRDITENNVLDNFRYVFSTGPVIDSLSLSGKVVNASTLAGEKGLLVMMYQNTGDSVPLKQRPYYFTKTLADGSFRLTNLRAGRYQVFALDDKNQNYIYDNAEERIAFPDSFITLASNVDSLTMKLFREIPTKQKRARVSQQFIGRVTFVYALSLKDPQVAIRNLPPEMNYFTERSTTGDTLDVWLSTVTADSLRFVITDGGYRDSVMVKLQRPDGKKRSTGRGGNDSDPRKLRLASNAAGSFDQGKSLVVTASNPVREWQAANIILLRGKDTVKTDVSLLENKRRILFGNTFMPDSVYTLFIPPATVTDWFGQKNDTLRSTFVIRSSDSYGALSVTLPGLPEGKYLLRIVNDKDEPLREVPVENAKPILFGYLPAGQYRLKLIIDSNGNGKWDTGNYLQHRQPENVIYYAQPVRIRAGWDIDVEWIFPR
jgi:uncharacterized protein (DUF2141 family)